MFGNDLADNLCGDVVIDGRCYATKNRCARVRVPEDEAHAATTCAPSDYSTDDSDIDDGSPTSMVHVGAPPPPPPPIPQLGGLPPTH